MSLDGNAALAGGRGHPVPVRGRAPAGCRAGRLRGFIPTRSPDDRGHRARLGRKGRGVQRRLGSLWIAHLQIGDDDADLAVGQHDRPTDRYGQLQDGEEPVRRTEPLGSCVEVLAHQPQRQVGLGCQKQHEEGNGVGDLPLGQTDADGDGDEGDGEGRQ